MFLRKCRPCYNYFEGVEDLELSQVAIRTPYYNKDIALKLEYPCGTDLPVTIRGDMPITSLEIVTSKRKNLNDLPKNVEKIHKNTGTVALFSNASQNLMECRALKDMTRATITPIPKIIFFVAQREGLITCLQIFNNNTAERAPV